MRFEIPRLTRCCFCMPLRRGVLTLGCAAVVLSSFMIGVCGYFLHYGRVVSDFYLYTPVAHANIEVTLAMYCLQLLANIVLICGALKENVLCLKIFYYYTLSTIGAILIVQIVQCVRTDFATIFEVVILSFTEICFQTYLLILVRSLLMKLEMDNAHQFHNELSEIVTGGRQIREDVTDNETYTNYSETIIHD